jgi:protein gp37
MGKTTIEWTTVTWNLVTGCDRISPECDHCYALRMAKRLKAMYNLRYQQDGDPRTSGPGFGVTLHWDKIEEPLHWHTPRSIFVNSMSDLFHARVPLEFMQQAFATMRQADWHIFQILTKRATRLCRLAPHLTWAPNIWMGVSVGMARYVSRIDKLRQVPAQVRFLSCEPLLEDLGPLDLTGIHWVIVGGESGPGARPMAPDSIRNIRAQCQAAGVAFFFKQWGGIHKGKAGRLLDGRTWDEMPLPVKEKAA